MTETSSWPVRAALLLGTRFDAAAAAGDMPKVKADVVVAAALEVIADALKEGRGVRLPGFGTFSISQLLTCVTFERELLG